MIVLINDTETLEKLKDETIHIDFRFLSKQTDDDDVSIEIVYDQTTNELKYTEL